MGNEEEVEKGPEGTLLKNSIYLSKCLGKPKNFT